MPPVRLFAKASGSPSAVLWLSANIIILCMSEYVINNSVVKKEQILKRIIRLLFYVCKYCPFFILLFLCNKILKYYNFDIWLFWCLNIIALLFYHLIVKMSEIITKMFMCQQNSASMFNCLKCTRSSKIEPDQIHYFFIIFIFIILTYFILVFYCIS